MKQIRKLLAMALSAARQMVRGLHDCHAAHNANDGERVRREDMWTVANRIIVDVYTKSQESARCWRA
jgi:hypothetical protein